MRIENLKITDGDFVLIHLEGENLSSAHIEKIREKFTKWAVKRGLNDVDFMISAGPHKINVTKMTVNDVFEDEVLKGKTDE